MMPCDAVQYLFSTTGCDINNDESSQLLSPSTLQSYHHASLTWYTYHFTSFHLANEHKILYIFRLMVAPTPQRSYLRSHQVLNQNKCHLEVCCMPFSSMHSLNCISSLVKITSVLSCVAASGALKINHSWAPFPRRAWTDITALASGRTSNSALPPQRSQGQE
jgi:hypothetical protein